MSKVDEVPLSRGFCNRSCRMVGEGWWFAWERRLNKRIEVVVSAVRSRQKEYRV